MRCSGTGRVAYRRVLISAVAIALGVGCSSARRPWSLPTLGPEYSVIAKANPPKEAYLHWKAEKQGRDLAVVASEDQHLSTSVNPFNHDDVGAVAAGRTMYVTHCASCHGADADGRGAAARFESPRMSFHDPHKRAYVQLFGQAPKNWFTTIAAGTTSRPTANGSLARMPGFEQTLAREQIWLLVTYLEHETLHPGADDSASAHD